MSIARENLLIDRACRVLMRDRRYTKARSRALIRWLDSNFEPASDIAGRTLARLRAVAFDDLLSAIMRSERLPSPNALWVLGLFPDQYNRLLPHARQWLTSSSGKLRAQCACAVSQTLGDRLRNHQNVLEADVELARSVLSPLEENNPAIRVKLRDFERAIQAAVRP